MTATEERAAVLGASIERAGGRERVTGAQRYVADLRLEGVLHVKLLHLPVGHARIDSIDVTGAFTLDGVRHVLTAAELPQPIPRFGPSFHDRPVIASGEVAYYGEPVAAVAAETEDGAAAAVERIRVDWEELPGIYSLEEALAEGAPLVRDPELRDGDPWSRTNVLREHRFGWGDVEAGGAALVVEDTYRFPMVSHFAIEPFAVLAAVQDGVLTVCTPIQHPFVLQRVLSEVTGLPVADVRVVVPDPGGGFGGKGYPKYEPLMAFMTMQTGRPVRLVLSLDESFQAARRAACSVRARTGVTADGTLLFQDLEADFLIGAYADIGDRVVSKASYTATGPYRTPNARIVARSVLSNTVPSTAFRGFGVPQLAWAVESQLDEVARRLGLDPLELRLRNLARKDEEFIPNDRPADGDWAEALRRAAEAIEWGTPVPAGRGRGLAMGLKSSATVSATSAIVRLHFDDSVSVLVGTTDIGQGARTVLAQLAAHELAVPIEAVRVVMGDTPSCRSTRRPRPAARPSSPGTRSCSPARTSRRSSARSQPSSTATKEQTASSIIGESLRTTSVPRGAS